ncbi:pilus assembly protein TadG-related protein [Streptomyces anandii]|uniref:pilus assembly protein TadG-related protein n=1 Tax=Streptomyces anandii TaxID=285454 RepID=UPI0016792CBA|nr:pilus assembly protein TadG-related protein [Streptomyces anandii]
MRRPRTYGDAGQAFPIYITVVGGLLFLAFAYFAVGQAAVNRNGAETAADAAALAAAQDTRDQLADQWVKDVRDPTKWQDIFSGNVQLPRLSCWRAGQLADQNDARVEACRRPTLLSYEVAVRTAKPVGDSLVPGTESRYSHESAIAVIQPLCTFQPLTEGAGSDALPSLICNKRTWPLDPKHLTDLPEPKDLFDVHLADR